MNDQRHEILLGYLAGALEPQEQKEIDAKLKSSQSLRDDLAQLCQTIAPLNEIADSHEPPVGLAQRTCQRLWSKTDASQKSEDVVSHVFTTKPHSSHSRRATIRFIPSQDVDTQNTDKSKSNINSDILLPLSQAVTHVTPTPNSHDKHSLLKPQETSKTIRRIDTLDTSKSKISLIVSETPSMIVNKHVKYYGEKNKTTKKDKRSWTFKDIIASLFVGMAAAILIFPLVQRGLSQAKKIIIQKKVQQFAENVPNNNSSQYSPYGLSQSDLRLLTNMNFDSNSASQLQNYRTNSAFSSFYQNAWISIDVQNSSLAIPYLFPVNISDPSFLKYAGLNKPKIVPMISVIHDTNIYFVPQQSDSVVSFLKNDFFLFSGRDEKGNLKAFPNYSFPILKESADNSNRSN
ncbi:MAG: hypothetical protein LBT05_01680 [Planctomycetaceae bacterium]|jgi:hypothetical protein|nr:hypothetical protein [Planctomycetaceae bacterium]